MKTTAIVINYRNASLTQRCVASLLGQLSSVIVVDNSAREEELGLLRNILSGPHLSGIRIHIVSTSANLGFSAGINFGIAADPDPETDAYLIFNNDAIASHGMVAALQGVAQESGKKALVYGHESSNCTSIKGYHRFFALNANPQIPGVFRCASGACLFVPAELARPTLFDEEFFMYGEDVELSWRMLRRTVPVIEARSATYTHTAGTSSRKGSLFYETCVARGHVLLAKKLSHGRIDRAFLTAGRFLSLPLRATWRCLKNRNLNAWRGLWIAVFNPDLSATELQN